MWTNLVVAIRHTYLNNSLIISGAVLIDVSIRCNGFTFRFCTKKRLFIFVNVTDNFCRIQIPRNDHLNNDVQIVCC